MNEPTAVERWAMSRTRRAMLWDVEERVLLEHPSARRWPSIVRRLGHSTPWTVVMVIILLATIGAPVAIAQTLGLTRRGMDESLAVPLAGVCYVLSVVLLVVSILNWYVEGRTRDKGTFGPVLTVLGAAVAGLVLARSDGLDLGPGGVVAWIAGIGSGLAVVVMLVAGVPHTSPARPQPVEVDRLDAADRARLLELRQQVLEILRDRSLLRPAVAEQARSTPLGALGDMHTPIQPKDRGDA